MAEICASQSRDIVSALIIKSFSARSVAEQRLIYEQNRLPPKLGLQCRGRKFRAEWYEKKDCRGGLRHSQHSQVIMSDYLKWNLPTIHFHFDFIHLGRVAFNIVVFQGTLH